jgi:hypothetical protein
MIICPKGAPCKKSLRTTDLALTRQARCIKLTGCLGFKTAKLDNGIGSLHSLHIRQVKVKLQLIT